MKGIIMSVDWTAVEWYERTRTSGEGGPTVTINKAGRTILNQAALSLFGQVPEALQVGVIQGQRGKTTLVLQAASKGDAGSLALSTQGTKVSINSGRFYKNKGFEKFFATSYSKPEYDSEHNALVISL
jgi:hypothetical protein